MKRFAQLISVVFQPVFILLVIVYFSVYKHSYDVVSAFKWTLYSAIFVVLGIVVFLWARYRKIFSDFDVTKRRERYDFYLLLFVFSAIYFTTTLGFKGIFFPLTLISFGILFGIVFFAIVNFSLKLSLHLAVLCAFVTTVFVLYGFRIFLYIFLFIPLVAWSRFFLRKHTLLEIITGGVLGVAVTLITFIIGKLLYF